MCPFITFYFSAESPTQYAKNKEHSGLYCSFTCYFNTDILVLIPAIKQ